MESWKEGFEGRKLRMKSFARTAWLGVVLGGCLAGCTTASTADAEMEIRKLFPAPKIAVPSGTVIHVVLKEGVGTDLSTPGTEFSVNLAEAVTVNGKTILNKGTAAVGRVVDVRRPGRIKGRASLSLVLTSVERNGRFVPVETKTYVAVADSDHKRDAGIIGGAAGVGAVIGAITGGRKGAATGAAIGGAGGTATVLANRGHDLHYPPEYRLNFVLVKSLTI
jgi:hypothetical protein